MNDIKDELMGRLRQNRCSSEKVTSNRKHPKVMNTTENVTLPVLRLYHINHYVSTTLSESIFLPACDPNKDGSQIHLCHPKEVRYRG
jgi:hypothetical protein